MNLFFQRTLVMKNLNKTLISAALATTLLGAGAVHAFSFDFGDDNDFYYPYAGVPYAGAPAYAPPPGYYLPPRLPSYERNRLRTSRQDMMDDHRDALNELSAMLYGGKGFDRSEAVQLARRIQSGSGMTLLRNFHPGSIATWGSRALPSVWSNQEAFKANADALGAAAGALAEALAKKPTPDTAILLPRRNAPFDCKKGDEACSKVPVDPSVWEKFNDLSATCEACHAGFRGFGWW